MPISSIPTASTRLLQVRLGAKHPPVRLGRSGRRHPDGGDGGGRGRIRGHCHRYDMYSKYYDRCRGTLLYAIVCTIPICTCLVPKSKFKPAFSQTKLYSTSTVGLVEK